MAPQEKKEKKRKRDKDGEKSAKKQKQEESPTTQPRTEGDAEIERAEKKKQRKEKKTKAHGDEQTNGAEAIVERELEDGKQQQTDTDTRTMEARAITAAEEDHLQKHTPFMQRTTSLYLPLSPCASHFPLEGLLAEHVSPLLVTYYPPLQGVLLSYSNARLSQQPETQLQADPDERVLGLCINEYAVSFIWLTADFMLFRPRRGTWMEGYVRLGNESMIGLVCYNYFNAVIEREKMPKDWTWVAEEHEEEKMSRRLGVESAGHFLDGKGRKVEGRLVFRVEDFDALQGDAGGSVSVMGTLLAEESGR